MLEPELVPVLVLELVLVPVPVPVPVPDKPSWKTPLNPIDFCIFHYYSTWGI